MFVSNSISEKVINEIKGVFTIPSYQRGYKWTDIEVKALMNDILEHSQQGVRKYCLQTITVSGDNIVDGQQRFTTIYIILKYLCKDPGYKLAYETRQCSQAFLENICSKEKTDNSNPDYYHMSLAYITAKTWFEDKENVVDREQFLESLLHQTFFIWYEVSSSEKDARDVFTRINMGKIPLTNAELVRAILLKKSNFPSDKGSILQHQIANEWEYIENHLYDDKFWYFLCLDKHQAESYDTRIELILEIVAGYKHVKHYFSDELKNSNISKIWDKVKSCYDTVKEWFDDAQTYHDIGFLITSNVCSIVEIYNSRDWKIWDKTKQSLKNINIDDLRYGEHNRRIEKVLLIFNILSYLTQKQCFPFDLYKKEKQSLEHIHPQHPETINPEQQKTWREAHSEQLKSIDKDSFHESFNSLNGEGPVNIHGLGNLTLLSHSLNASLNNSSFLVKKQKLEKHENQNKVLLCTKAVFNKCTNSKIWSEDNAATYIEHIKETLNDFIK